MQYYYILEKLQIQQNKIDTINKAIIHIYIILLILTSLFLFHLTL
jgi:hypothetical protein